LISRGLCGRKRIRRKRGRGREGREMGERSEE